MKDEGTLAAEHVNYGKYANVGMALGVAREARAVLGANGITLAYPVIRHMNNLESVYTYEGTNEIHTLVLGQAITGIAAFE
jgi:glutaryl-CoA dehydrogenase